MCSTAIDCSIIIPAYNAENTIDRCLKSLDLESSSKNIEVIVVDDGSTDKTKSIAENYLNTFENSKVITKTNGGVSSARNAGIGEAQGRYLYFCDADDEIIRSALNKAINCAKNVDCDVLIAKYKKSCADGGISENIPQDRLLNRQYIIDTILKGYIIGSEPATTCNKIYKKDVIDRAYLRFDELKTHGEIGLLT